MRQVVRELRRAYIEMLSGITYKGVAVPVKAGIMTDTGALITIAPGVDIEVYILITNQTRGVNSLKNALSYNSTITVDINTVFKGSSYNSGGSSWVEELTDIFYDIMFNEETFKLKEFGLNYDRFIITTTTNYIQPMPLQYNDSSKTYRSVIVFEHGIQSAKLTEPEDNFWIKTIE